MPSPDTDLVLDFTPEGRLPPVLLRRLDALATQKRDTYNSLIDRLSEARGRDIDWWVSLPASRNTHAGKLFDRCVQLALVRDLTENGHVVSVRTDDIAQAAVLRAAGFRVTPLPSKRKWRSIAHNVASSLFHALSARRAARATRRLARAVPEGAGLLEIYVQRDSFDGGTFRDRYYPGFYESLDSAEKARFFYLPIFHRIRDYGALFQCLRQAPQNFLLREDYLTLGDYLFAFGHWWRAGQLKGMRAVFAGFDIGAMLDAELDTGRFTNMTIQALLAYRFWQHRAPMACATLVDWHEGHNIDHATAAAIRWHGSNTRLVAMRPIAPDAYLSLTPTAGEIQAETVAAEWAVIGGAKRQAIAAAFPQLKVRPAPGLRHRALRTAHLRRRPDEPFTVLVLLSIETEIARLAARVIGEVGDTSFRWHIKRHPSMPRVEAERIFSALGVTANFVEGEFSTALAQADAVAGQGTNTLIEAAAMGVPVICLSGGNRPTELLFGPEETVWWRTVYDGAGLMSALTETRGSPNSPKTETRENLLGPFEPIVLKEHLFPAE